MSATLLRQALCEPRALQGWSSMQWEELIRQARGANLLGRLAAVLEDLGSFDAVPRAPRAHLEAARVVCTAQGEAVRREVALMRKALAGVCPRVVLLKGAAYLFAGLPAARGRLFSDIDILVPEALLAVVEAALMQHGWASTHHNAYDQRYYRRWSHELPPMRHVSRQSLLDVHHSILPRTARLKPEAAKLLEAARPLAGNTGLHVPCPADLVLHSATHLFLNESLASALRDLVDLDSLLRHFGAEPAFWEALLERARELSLERPLHYALRYTERLLGTPIPGHALRAAQNAAPAAALAPLMDFLFIEAMDGGRTAWRTTLARQALYVRGHWLRMPLPLLAFHLTVKAFRSAERPAD